MEYPLVWQGDQVKEEEAAGSDDDNEGFSFLSSLTTSASASGLTPRSQRAIRTESVRRPRPDISLRHVYTYQNSCSVSQLIKHGTPEEVLERVEKVSSELYKLEREENLKNSRSVKLLSDLIE
ncbi:hypothetical protein Fmac_029603 [Flemingia macrophylla]|uniref:Uncharacterized protein n=1 Tax=Flemingia macrophylla TaxID=520843 RepID=A0ABD1LAS9_9FABA